MHSDYYVRYYAFEHDHWWFVARRNVVFSLLDRYLLESKRATPETDVLALDMGCGTGITMQHLRNYGPVVGVDSASEAIEFCKMRELGLVGLLQADVRSLPLKEKTFDVVLALDVIEHLDDDNAALNELTRVLKPDGIAIITVPAFAFLWSAHDVINHHKRRYRLLPLLAQIKQSGLIIQRASYYNMFLFPVAAGLRLIKHLIYSAFPKSIDKVQSDFVQHARLVNYICEKIFSAEAWLLPWVRFPFGVSIIAVVTRNMGPKKD